jgi:Hsp70 protein
VVLTWLKAGNPRPQDWDHTTLGRLRLDGSRLVSAATGDNCLDKPRRGSRTVGKSRSIAPDQEYTWLGRSSASISGRQNHAAEDQQRRALIDARNEADALAYSVEKVINEHRTRIPVGDLSRIESAIAELRSLAQRDDLQAIQRKIADVQRDAQTLADLVSRATPPPSSQGSSVQDGEVVDAEPVESHNG